MSKIQEKGEPRGNDRSSLWSQGKRKKNGLFVAVRGSILATDARKDRRANREEKKKKKRTRRLKDRTSSTGNSLLTRDRDNLPRVAKKIYSREEKGFVLSRLRSFAKH